MTVTEQDKEALRLQLSKKLQNGAVPNGFKVEGWSKKYPLFDYQETGVMWLYLNPRALLADQTGTGKTCHALALLKYLKNKGRVRPDRRAVIIVPAQSVDGTWDFDGFKFFKPGLKYAVAAGTKAQRRKVYDDPTWEVLLISYHTARNDVAYLVKE